MSSARLADELGWTVAATLLVLAFYAVQLPFEPDFFFHDDMQLQYVPGSFRIGSSLLAGELPTITPSTWSGGALAGEFQFGVFSLFRVTLDVFARRLGLGLFATATWLCLSHLAVLAAGLFRFARGRGVERRHALLLAFCVGTNGWVAGWGCNWLPALASFAWLPWFALGLQRFLERRGGAAWPALFLYLLSSAGWPYTILMSVLVAAFVVVPRLLDERSVAPLGRLALVGLVGLLLAAPALSTFLDYARTTLRVDQGGLSRGFTVPPSAWPALFLPAYESVWSPAFARNYTPHTGVELACGVVPAAWLAHALVRDRGRRLAQHHRAEVALVALVAALAVLPSPGRFQWSFRWLPLFHLALVLAATRVEGLYPGDRLRHHPAVVGIVAVLVGWGWARAHGFGDPAILRSLSLCIGSFLAFWALSDHLLPARSGLRRAMPLVVAVSCQVATFVVVRPWNEMLGWGINDSIREPGAFSPSRLYLAIVDRTDLHPIHRKNWERAGMRPGGLPSLAGLRSVNGYSPMHPRGVAEVFGMGEPGSISVGTHGDLRTWNVAQLHEVAMVRGGLLDRLGIDGLVLPVFGLPKPPIERLLESGWTLEATLFDAWVLHRAGPPSADARCVAEVRHVTSPAGVVEDAYDPGRAGLAHLLSSDHRAGSESFATCTLGPLGARETAVEIDVTVPPGDRDALVVFRRAWDIGYEAALDGRPLPISAFEAVALAVRVPAGAHGHLVVRHRPRVLRVAFPAAALGLLGLLVAVLARRMWATEGASEGA